MAVDAEIACLTCLHSIQDNFRRIAHLDRAILGKQLRRLAAGNVYDITEIPPYRPVCAGAHGKQPVFTHAIADIGISPAHFVDKVLSLTQVNST